MSRKDLEARGHKKVAANRFCVMIQSNIKVCHDRTQVRAQK